MQKKLLVFYWGCLFMTLTLSSLGQKSTDEFLISIYSPPPAEYMNDEQYRIMKDAHIDYIFNIGPGVASDKEGNLKTLDIAKKHGMSVYAYDIRVHGSNDDIKMLVNDYKSHTALAGYYVTDEPDSTRLQLAIDAQKTIKRLDKGKDAYVNHLPDWAIPNYEAFLRQWIEGVEKENLNYLAFDNYPFKKKQRLEKTYFNNLDIIRRLGLEYHVKTSSCLQSFGMSFSGNEELRRPTSDEMRWNVYSNLAYGVKNAVWYPYWTTIKHGDVISMSPCIIDENGAKTDLYEPFRILNGEMKQLGKTLIRLEAREVYHTGDSLWIGTTQPPANFLWKVSDDGADVILSHLVDPNDGKEYIMVVNKSFKDAGRYTFNIKNSIKNIKEISKTTGKPIKSAYDPLIHSITETFLPGEGKLYALD